MTILQDFQNWLADYLPQWAAYIIPAIVGIIVMLVFVFGMIIVLIYVERRLLGRFQIRLGPNRLGPEGIFQPLATAAKILLKEDICPALADKVIHWLAPVVVFIPIIMIFAVVPLQENVMLADLNVGVVYIIAISSISAVGVYMAGWGSNNKYSMISAFRTVGQMVSYELPIILTILGIVIMAGSLSLNTIVQAQDIPFILIQPLGFIIFFLGTLAEMNRSPFDLLEADSEIVAGYHTEYSGMKFAMFYLGEYGHSLVYSAIIADLYLGGWRGPLIPPFLWFLIKLLIIFFVIVWIRATLPRLRVDQLMSFAWKGLLPMSVLNLFIVGAEVLWMPKEIPWMLIVINVVCGALIILLWSRLFTPGGKKVVS